MKTKQLRLFKGQIAVYSENHSKNISTRCRKNSELFNIKQVVYLVTTVFSSVNKRSAFCVMPSL
jgi:hypothetical protein